MKTYALIQARMGSTRLPGKVLKKINGKTLIEIMLNRLKNSQQIDKIIVATSKNKENDLLSKIVCNLGYSCFRGSENDVLDRFYNAVKNDHCDYIVRLTADCPLIDPILIDQVIEMTIKSNVDYGSNSLKEEFPDGQDTEVFKYESLKKTWINAKLPLEREHVTPYLRKNTHFFGKKIFSSKHFNAEKNLGFIRMTVDELDDFDAIETLINNLGENCGWLEYANFILNNQTKFKNQKIIRNEGYAKSLKND